MSEKAAVIKGHGHVTPNADGSRTRCGGPTICKVCKAELAALKTQPSGLVPDSVDEAASILRNMIDSIGVHGNYSQESTLQFLNQALGCLDEVARLNSSPVSAGGVDERVREALRECLEVMELHRLTGQVYANGRAALSAPSHGEQVREWNLAADELPASGKPVLVYYLNSHGMERRIRAMHVKRFTVEAEEFADPDTQCVEYSEQDDCYYTTEGWYELIDNWPDYSSCAVIEGVVTHWMPLPAAPSAGSQKEQE